jgi:hypothetical protein
VAPIGTSGAFTYPPPGRLTFGSDLSSERETDHPAGAGLYLLFALIGRFIEEMGAVECGCKPKCWCKRSGLSLFRWVIPPRHHHLWTAEVFHDPDHPSFVLLPVIT